MTSRPCYLSCCFIEHGCRIVEAADEPGAGKSKQVCYAGRTSSYGFAFDKHEEGSLLVELWVIRRHQRARFLCAVCAVASYDLALYGAFPLRIRGKQRTRCALCEAAAGLRKSIQKGGWVSPSSGCCAHLYCHTLRLGALHFHSSPLDPFNVPTAIRDKVEIDNVGCRC